MNTIMIFLLPALALVLISLPLVSIYKGKVSGAQMKNRVIMNLCGFFGICLLSFVLPVGGMISAYAAEAGAVASVVGTAAQGMGFLSAALATGLSSVGAGIAVASAAPAAIGAFSEDPKAFGKAMIFVALGEGVALYGVLISILILNKI